MNYRVLGSVTAAAAIAFAQPVAFVAQEASKAAEIIAAARNAIGSGRLDAMKTFSVQSSIERNVNDMQFTSDVEIVLDLPDKYLRDETPSGGGGGIRIVAGAGVSGFNGDKPLQKVQSGSAVPAGGGLMIRMGGGAVGGDDKLTPEQIEQMSKALVRSSRIEISRLMLGWFAAAHPSANAEYVYAGEAESLEGKAYVIDVKNADNLNVRLFVDEQTKLPLMVTYKGPQPRIITSTASTGHADVGKQIDDVQRLPPAMVDYAVYFEDWRDVDGIKFPYRMRRAMAGTTTEEWTVHRVKVNPKIDPKRFAGES